MTYEIVVIFTDGVTKTKELPCMFSLNDVRKIIGTMTMSLIFDTFVWPEVLGIENVMIKDKTKNEVVFDLHEEIKRLVRAYQMIEEMSIGGDNDKAEHI